MRASHRSSLAACLVAGGVVFLALGVEWGGSSREVEPLPSTSVGASPEARGTVARILEEAAPPTLRGGVTDERGVPVPHVRILATSTTSGSVEWTADSRGRFRVDLPDTGDWALHAAPVGFRPWERTLPVPIEGTELDIELTRWGTLAGFVRGRDAGAQFSVQVEDETGVTRDAGCDRDGAYGFEALPPGAYRVHLSAGPQEWEDVGALTIRAGEGTRFDIPAPEMGGLEIEARLPAQLAGRPQPAEVELLPEGAEPHAVVRHRVVLSPEGLARLPSVPAGRYDLQVRLRDLPDSQRVRFETRLGDLTRIRVSWDTAAVEGRITDALGRGTPATVQVQSLRRVGDATVADSSLRFEISTSEDGDFALGGLAAGAYRVSARGAGYATTGLTLARGETGQVELRFEEPQELAVRLQSSGRPVPGAIVLAIRLPYSDMVVTASTDARGEAQVTGLPSGTYKLVARATPNAIPTGFARVEVRPGPREVVTMELER